MKLTVLAAVVAAASLTTGSDALMFMSYNDHDPTLPNCNDVTIASPYGKNTAKCSCDLSESKVAGSLVKHKQIASWKVPYYEVECIPRRRSLREYEDDDLGFGGSGRIRLPPMCGPGYSLTGRPCKKPKTYIYDEDEDDDLGGRGGKCSNENFSYLEQSNLKTWADKAEARKQMMRYRPCAKAIFKRMCSSCGYDTGCYKRNGQKFLTPATLPSQCKYLLPK